MHCLHLTNVPVSDRVRWAREAVLFQLAHTRNVQDRTELATGLTETLEQLNTPAEWTERTLSVIEQLSDHDLETLIVISKTLLSGAEPEPHTQPSATKRIEVEFTDSGVMVDGDNWGKDAPLLLFEFLILRRRKVYWPWACIILPEFNVADPDYQFRNYVSKKRKDLTNRGIQVRTFKKKGQDGFAIFEGMDNCLVSNIKEVRAKYEQALSLYNNGNLKEAVVTLSCITNDIRNQWYTFTDAYMDLARWICELNFKNVAEDTMRKCRKFLEWYFTRLRLGISKIERYAQRKGLSTEASNQLQNIETELEKAEELCSALVKQVPPDKEEQAYKDFVNLLLDFREKLVSINEESEREVDKETTGEVIELLAEKHKGLAEIVEYGRNIIDELLERKHQRQQCSEIEIRDMHRCVCWQLAELIVEIANFDEFDRKESNKLQQLKDYLCSRLRNQLEEYI